MPQMRICFPRDGHGFDDGGVGAGFELGLEAGEEFYEAVLRFAFEVYGLREHAVADAVLGADFFAFGSLGPVERRSLAR